MLEAINKFKGYIPGIGLIGLSVYQASVGNIDTAGTTFLMALGLLGLRSPTPTPSVPKS